MENTGERYLPNTGSSETGLEHWHRYLYAREFAHGKSVLDIACGEGYGSDLLSSVAKNVVGVDIDEQAIDLAKKKYNRENLKFIRGSVEKVPISGNGVFDLVVSFETIEHVDIQKQQSFLTEVRRLLKHDGVMLISTPNKKIYSDKSEISNRFHMKEFYKDEFVKSLSMHFLNVYLFEQDISLSSHIWSDKLFMNLPKEYPLEVNGDQYILRDHIREGKYFIAICSNSKLYNIGGTWAYEEVPNRQNEEIESIKASLSWKVTRPLRQIKCIVKQLFGI